MQFRKAVLLCCLTFFSVTGFAAEKTINKPVYGRYEKIKMMDLNGALIPAKIDTGAMTASLSATDIKMFKKDGEDWVRFTPQVKGQKLSAVELPLVRVGKIKRRAADISDVTIDSEDDSDEEDPNYTYRPEVEMKVCIGDQLKTINVNLTDRSSFSYPLLIGAKALRQFKAVVDPSLKYQLKATCAVK
ncbi:ATP-dependent zinc protease family protein [Entomomonas asaccharolytica]|uniref:ATP-dependent zinc protease n=1 Tax=Entomomonas asaccharolytica TaxID=2785331 RepID=A0A974RZJ7_9GAMM|nr:ATP-dependent zinc protease [Entomomonas asaccharolytica]QQP87139.1 ATP-dependent zinc protease [Entomomonas asaccharolytica]